MLIAITISFLSDLCGREGQYFDLLAHEFFLSDLCGREVEPEFRIH